MRKSLLLLLLGVNVCFAETYTSNLEDYVVRTKKEEFEQDVKYISAVASCCACISSIYDDIAKKKYNFITRDFKRYKKSIFEIIPQAVAKCILKIDEFANVKNDIVEFNGVDETQLTQAEVNAVVLYNWIYQISSNKGKLDPNKLKEHIENHTKIDKERLTKAISDIKAYDETLQLTKYLNNLRTKITETKDYPNIRKTKYYPEENNVRAARIELATSYIKKNWKTNKPSHFFRRLRILLCSGHHPIVSIKKIYHDHLQVSKRAFYIFNNAMQYQGTDLMTTSDFENAQANSFFGKLWNKYSKLYYLDPLTRKDPKKALSNDNVEDIYKIDLEYKDSAKKGKTPKELIIRKLSLNKDHEFFKEIPDATYKIVLYSSYREGTKSYKIHYEQKQEVSANAKAHAPAPNIFDFSLNSNNKIMLKLGSISTGKIILPSDCKELFANQGLSSIDIKNTDATNVTNATGMFKNNHELETIKGLNVFDKSKLTDISYMFSNTGLKEIDINWSHLGTTVNAKSAFCEMKNLETAKINLERVSLVNVSSMFSEDKALKNVTLTNTLSSVRDMTTMFYGCSELKTIGIDFKLLNANRLYHDGNKEGELPGYRVENAFAICSSLENLTNFTLFLDDSTIMNEYNKKTYRKKGAFDLIPGMFYGCANMSADFKSKYDALIENENNIAHATHDNNKINWDGGEE